MHLEYQNRTNGAAGISIILDSVADLTGITFVSGNTGLGVFISADSAVRITSGDVQVDGETPCGDQESSFFNRGDGYAEGPINCSGF